MSLCRAFPARPTPLSVALLCLFPVGGALCAPPDAFRADALTLNGVWKFQLRRDNPLTTAGPVRFGPLSASSQALFLSPGQAGGKPPLRWNVSVPWPLAGTLLGSGPVLWNQRQIWKPHETQQGASWWQADLGGVQNVTSIHVHWASKEHASVSVEAAKTPGAWTALKDARVTAAGNQIIISGKPIAARFLKLTFEPGRFGGTDRIDVFVAQGQDGVPQLWQPRVQRSWFDDLLRFERKDGFEKPGFADAGWAEIRVPGTWEEHKFAPPTWWQPDDTVGYYRRIITVPENWRGRQVRLRFEGANNGTEVWINGTSAGCHESGFTSFEFDITPHLRLGGQNTIAVRVAKWTLTHEYDTDDAWFLGGLWRDVSLYSLPADRIDDFRILTTFDSAYRDAALHVETTLRGGPGPAVLEGTLLDGDGKPVPVDGLRSAFRLAGDGFKVSLSGAVRAPRKWTAETPYLYTLELRLLVAGQIAHRFRTPLGFRQVETRGSSILLNGVPLKIRGVVTTRSNPHDSGESPDAVFRREIRLLKEGNINAIRSHTTQLEDAFLDLCDRSGIYVIPDVPNVWVNQRDFQPLADGVVQRAREVYERHKNRASVIAWHIGNENRATSAYYGDGRAALWLHENDPSRPVGICDNAAGADGLPTQFTDLHYRPMSKPDFSKDPGVPVLFGEFHAVPEDIERLSDRGFVESWGSSLRQEWSEFEMRPWVAGGLICCWDDGAVNGDIGPRQWGVLDSKRRAKPVHFYIRKAFAPVRLELLDGGRLAVENRYAFTDLEGFRFVWRAGSASGEWRFRVPPGGKEIFDPKLPPGPWRVEVFDAAGYSVQEEEFRRPLPPADPAPLHTGKLPAPFHHRVATDGSLVLSDGRGRDLLSIRSLEVRKGRQTTEPVGKVERGPFRVSGDVASAPIRIASASATFTGQLRVELGSSLARVGYSLTADKSVAVSEWGVSLDVHDALPGISIRRDALWDKGALEALPVSGFPAFVSARHVRWAAFDTEGVSVLLAPLNPTTNLRAGDAPRRFVVSDFLGSGDFLGRFDTASVQKSLKAGETISGGFTLRFLAAPPAGGAAPAR